MQNSAFKTLFFIAKRNFKQLILTFSLVLAENGLFLIYPIIAGIAINAVITGDTLLGLSYSTMILSVGAWVLLGGVWIQKSLRKFMLIWS